MQKKLPEEENSIAAEGRCEEVRVAIVVQVHAATQGIPEGVVCLPRNVLCTDDL